MEWTAVTVLIALFGFVATLLKPIVSLTRSITSLTVVVERLEAELRNQEEHSREGRRRLWEHNDEQDRRLDDHEQRLGKLEDKTE